MSLFSFRRRASLTALASALLAASLAGCGGQAVTSGGDSSSAYNKPRTVMSCGEKLTFTKAPSRVLILNDTDLSVMDRLGLLSKVTAHSGPIAKDAHSARAVSSVTGSKELKGTAVSTGGTTVSTESIIAANVDLVIGYDQGVDRKALREAGIPLYSPDAFCPNPPTGAASWQQPKDEVTKVATIFGVEDKAAQVNKDMDARVAGLKSSKVAPRPAVALYVTPGSGDIYAYGASSMTTPVFEAAGLSNIYKTKPERVFDASLEDVIEKNPETIVLLHGDGKAQAVKETFMKLPGASSLSAVKNGRVITMPAALIDPASPLSIESATRLAKETRK